MGISRDGKPWGTGAPPSPDTKLQVAEKNQWEGSLRAEVSH